MKRKLFLLWTVTGALLISCVSTATPTALPTTVPVPVATAAPQEVVAARAAEALQALRSQDLETLVSMIHPGRGLRFSPYAFVQDSDLVFSPGQLERILSEQTEYMWGVYDGSGLPIEMSFAEYYGRFVYDQDYVNAERIGYNERIGQGNTIDNSLEYYPGAIVVEYHFSGFDPELGGMDWRSLRLVFQEEESVWYLVGIIHDEWTI